MRVIIRELQDRSEGETERYLWRDTRSPGHLHSTIRGHIHLLDRQIMINNSHHAQTFICKLGQTGDQAVWLGG
jgi:hypothetical protein